jgi:hypothetical protein
VKRSSWRLCCEDIVDVPSSAILVKIMVKEATSRVGCMELVDFTVEWRYYAEFTF